MLVGTKNWTFWEGYKSPLEKKSESLGSGKNDAFSDKSK